MVKSKTMVILLVMGLLVPALSAKAANEGCLELIMNNCTSCHYQTRICEKIDKKSKRAWKKSIKRMLRYGLKMDKRTQGKAVDCLLSMKKEDPGLCK